MSWGRSAAYRPCRAEEVEAVKRRHGIASSYVLTFVTSHPRKNAARVVAAWTALPDWVHREYQLVVVGIRGVTPSDDARVRYLVDVPEDDMPALTTGAAAMCYLSLSEGFGLPVLEAFSCGTPVIASSTSSLPEIAGDAAVLADPASPPAIQDAIVRVLSSADLRGELRERGLARATLFDWRDCAEAYAQIFEECLG